MPAFKTNFFNVRIFFCFER